MKRVIFFSYGQKSIPAIKIVTKYSAPKELKKCSYFFFFGIYILALRVFE